MFISLGVFILLTQCTENESENIVLPGLISASATLLSNSQGYNHVEFNGEFTAGAEPVTDIKLAWAFSPTPNPQKNYFIDKSVDFMDSNTFKVEFQTYPLSTYSIAFYFISKGAATYSETYQFSVVDNKVLFYKGR